MLGIKSQSLGVTAPSPGAEVASNTIRYPLLAPIVAQMEYIFPALALKTWLVSGAPEAMGAIPATAADVGAISTPLPVMSVWEIEAVDPVPSVTTASFNAAEPLIVTTA